MLRGELGAQREGDEQEDDEPAGMQIYGYAENAADLKAAGELAGTGAICGGGRSAGVVLVGSGRGGHVVSVWLKPILAEVGRLRGCGDGGFAVRAAARVASGFPRRVCGRTFVGALRGV